MDTTERSAYHRPILLFVAIAALALMLAALVQPVAAQDPPGNNTTVKVDGVPLDNGEPGDTGPGDPDNEPHILSCFAIDWYGFDMGELYGSVTFEAWAPTGWDVLPFEVIRWREPVDGHDAFAADGSWDVYIGEDSNDGGGSVDGLDASVVYDISEGLAAIEPHDQQGWHVRVTVRNDGSQGADVKHKVFWVEGPCAVETNPPNGGTSTPNGTTTPTFTPTPTPTGTGGEQGGRSPNTASGLTVGHLVTMLAGLLLVGSLVTLGLQHARAKQ